MKGDSVLHRARLLARRNGIDFHRWPSQDPDYLAFRAFTALGPDVILDVGANDGGFARECRGYGFEGEIVSFEPGTEAFARLKAASASDLLWDVRRMGVGDEPGELELQVAANAGASSSFLPMTAAHVDAAKQATYIATEKVRVARLDDFAAEFGQRWRRPALKIDTQGFERQVLTGAGALLDSVVAIRLELSLVPLYDGGWEWSDAIRWLEGRGMELVGVAPGFSDPRTGFLLQFDGVFARRF